MDLTERKHAADPRHPWELARAAFFIRLLDEHDLLKTGSDWLDAGAGDAWFANQLRPRLADQATVVCWDPNYTAEDLGAENPAGVTRTADRPAGPFDRLLLLDVIEHIEDDAGFLAGTVGDLLSNDAWAVVSVPAYQGLFTSHDRRLLHYRRYSPRACRSLVERSGLSVVADGGLFHSLLAVRAAQAGLERTGVERGASTGVGGWSGGQTTTKALTRVLTADTNVTLALSRRGRSLPGLSYWALCQRSA